MTLVTPVFALTSYQAKFSLYVETDLGALKIGKANFALQAKDDMYVYTSKAFTSSLWKTLYDYSRTETSIGMKSNNDIVSSYYIVNENVKGSTKNDYEIYIYAEQNYATYNGEKYKGEIEPGGLVDSLSVYLALSEDMKLNPEQTVFNYQVANSEGIKRQDFTVAGRETITINDKEIETNIILCPELNLSLNLAKEYGYLPVMIRKVNGKTVFNMKLTEYSELYAKGIS
ncbi:uncharacterized protein METZ01_LOCUS165609, partial [marine metagenome]